MRWSHLHLPGRIQAVWSNRTWRSTEEDSLINLPLELLLNSDTKDEEKLLMLVLLSRHSLTANSWRCVSASGLVKKWGKIKSDMSCFVPLNMAVLGKSDLKTRKHGNLGLERFVLEMFKNLICDHYYCSLWEPFSSITFLTDDSGWLWLTWWRASRREDLPVLHIRILELTGLHRCSVHLHPICQQQQTHRQSPTGIYQKL